MAGLNLPTPFHLWDKSTEFSTSVFINTMSNCKTCELVTLRDSGKAPLWDRIHRYQYWDVVHSFNTSLPGWLVLVARRHIAAIDELSEDESIELGILIRRVSVALKQVTGCIKTYVMQFAESPEHPHVHFHIVPRMIDQPEDCRSTKIFKYLGVSEEERVSETKMNELAARIQHILLSMEPEKS